MAVTRAYQLIGKIKNEEGQELQIWLGRYTAETADTYLRATQCTLTFNGLSRILDDFGDGVTHNWGVLALYSDAVSQLGNPLSFVSVTNAADAAPILQFAVLEGAGDGDPLDEKTNAEAYGRAVNFYAVVIGY